MEVDPQGTSISFRNVKGESWKILRLLDLQTPLKGAISGEFLYSKNARTKQESVSGLFQAGHMSFSGSDLDDVRGDLKSNMHDVELKNLNFRYNNGQGRAEVFIDYGNNAYAVSGSVKNIDIHQFRSDLKGRGDVDVDGRGVFLRDPLQLHFRLTNLSYYSDRPFEVKGEAQIMTDFSNYSITSRGEIVHSVSQSPFSLEFRPKRFHVLRLVQPDPERPEPADPMEEQQRRDETAGADPPGSEGRGRGPREWRRFRAKRCLFRISPIP